MATLGTAQLTVGMDVNFGDPIWPAPQLVELPRVTDLGLPPVTLLGYPLTMVLAEKIVTAIDRGVANTRWRDFADVYTLTLLHSVDAGELRTSIETVAEYRKVTLAALLPTLAPMNERAQQKYRAWRTRSHREGELPAAFADVLTVVASFADPILSARTAGRWNPASAPGNEVPETINPGAADSWASRKRAALGLALVLTSAGMPPLFQGQELCEDRWFNDRTPLSWDKTQRHSSFLHLIRQLIRLRRNLDGNTAGLRGPHTTLLRVDDQRKVLIYHRWWQGGAGDDVLVAVNLSTQVGGGY